MRSFLNMASVEDKRCTVYDEFSPEQQRQIFGYSVNKALHHIDTLYYSVYLNEPKDIIDIQRDENLLPESFFLFLSCLRYNKDVMRDYSGYAPKFNELEMSLKSFAGYEYCVSLPECFDIFICRILPNADTPRIVVQLRSRYLVLEGVKQAVEKSFSYLREFLSPFGVFPVRVQENRVDYAFHTNLIQNPDKYFDTALLRNNLKTNLRKWSMYGDTRNFFPDTVNIGTRNSNSVFVRIYNKGREVIEMNYKSFFIERWYQNGLISAFDKYVYEKAYEMKAYRSGLLVGRLKWYIEHGNNEELITLCHELLGKCYINSDNFDFIEKRIHNVIPDVTTIINVEFQVKRKFFASCSEWMKSNAELSDFLVSEKVISNEKICFPKRCDPLLYNLFGLLFSSKDIIDYLTSFGNCVSFVEDRNMSFKAFKEAGENYKYWWSRLRGTPIDYSFSGVRNIYREYDVANSISHINRQLLGNVAKLSIFFNRGSCKNSFVENMADVLCILNDNDVEPSFIINEKKFLKYKDENGQIKYSVSNPKNYHEIVQRKERQLRGVFDHTDNKNNESQSDD